MTNSEIYIQNQILKYLKDLDKKGYHVYCERRQAGGFSYKKGIADVYCVINGYHIEIECKTNSGKLRPLQEKWKEYCESRNIGYILARSLDDVKLVIEKLLK